MRRDFRGFFSLFSKDFFVMGGLYLFFRVGDNVGVIRLDSGFFM